MSVSYIYLSNVLPAVPAPIGDGVLQQCAPLPLRELVPPQLLSFVLPAFGALPPSARALAALALHDAAALEAVKENKNQEILQYIPTE